MAQRSRTLIASMSEATLFRTLVLAAAYFFVITNVTVIVTMLPFMSNDIAMSEFQRAALLSIFPVVSLPANLIIGPIADRFDKRKFMLFGSALASISFTLSGMVSSADQAILLRALTALFMSMISLSIFSSIPDYFVPELRVKVTGYVSAAASLAQLVAIPAGVFIAETVGWRISFFVLAGYSCFLGVAIFGLPTPGYSEIQAGQMHFRSHARDMLSILRNEAFRRPLIGYAAFSCGMFVFLGLYPTWVLSQKFGETTGHSVSLIFVAGGIGGLSGAFLTGIMGARFSSSRWACSLLSALTAGSLVFVPSMDAVLAGQIMCYGLACTFRAIFLPIFISRSMSAAEPSQRGSTQGILAAVFQSGTAFGGAASAWLYSIDTTYHANISVALALFIAASFVFSRATSVEMRVT